MLRVTVAIAVVLWCGVGATDLADAGPNLNAKILVHLPGADKNPCAYVDVRVPCDRIVTNGRLLPWMHRAFIMVTDGNGSAGVREAQFSVGYQETDGMGLDIVDFTPCGAVVYPTDGPNGPWPSSGSTCRLVWDQCQTTEPGGPGTGVVTPVGYFYCGAYSIDSLRVIVSPVLNVATVSSCSGVVDTVELVEAPHSPSHLGFAKFTASGTESGYNPCGLATAVEVSTWSRMKNLFR